MEDILNNLLFRSIFIAVIALFCTGHVYGAQTINFGKEQSGITLLNQTQTGITLRADIGSVNLDEVRTREGSFTVLTVDGFTRSHEIGEPGIPMVNRLISIPFGCELRV
jgi:hypothetical protein